MKIKNVILDFGGILLDLNFKNTDDQFKSLFKMEFDDRAYPAEFIEIFDDYECGRFSEGSFLYRLQRLADHTITERQLIDAWNAMLVRIPRHRLDFLLELRKQYKVYLLSNTNHTHIQWALQYLKHHYGIMDFETRYFDHVYYSHDLQMHKPHHNIYQAVLADANILGAASIFIDDTMANVTAAKACGINAAQHDPNLEISDMLREYIAEVEH